jgi:hypothetical protein
MSGMVSPVKSATVTPRVLLPVAKSPVYVNVPSALPSSTLT